MAVADSIKQHVDTGVGVCHQNEEHVDGLRCAVCKVGDDYKGERCPAERVGEEEDEKGPRQLR